VFFVEARYHRNPEKVQIRYISHREERLLFLRYAPLAQPPGSDVGRPPGG